MRRRRKLKLFYATFRHPLGGNLTGGLCIGKTVRQVKLWVRRDVMETQGFRLHRIRVRRATGPMLLWDFDADCEVTLSLQDAERSICRKVGWAPHD